jgi:hypothetical protein
MKNARWREAIGRDFVSFEFTQFRDPAQRN